MLAGMYISEFTAYAWLSETNNHFGDRRQCKGHERPRVRVKALIPRQPARLSAWRNRPIVAFASRRLDTQLANNTARFRISAFMPRRSSSS